MPPQALLVSLETPALLVPPDSWDPLDRTVTREREAGLDSGETVEREEQLDPGYVRMHIVIPLQLDPG